MMDRQDKQPAAFRIGSTLVGPGRPAYVIAEAGVNHNGDLGRAREMVHAAAAAGADAVKFQFFRAEELTTRGAPSAAYQKAQSQRELLAALELSEADFAELAGECGRAGVAMLLTPFGPAQVEAIVRLRLPAIKLASPDVTNVPLLQAAGGTGLPVILSTGAATMEEIEAALDCMEPAALLGVPSPGLLRQGYAGHPLSKGEGLLSPGPVALLHCVSSYPTPLARANLGCIGTLAGRFGCIVGFSDHTVETVTGALAVQAGACMLEKHFTLNRSLVGPDHAMSLTPAELAEYIGRARSASAGRRNDAALSSDERAAFGDGRKGPQELEQEVRRVARSSVTSAVDIPAGTPLQRHMLTVKRPGGGIAPAEIETLAGRTAAVDISADCTIYPDMLR